MFRFIAKIAAKVQYIWRQEIEAHTNELHAGLAQRNAQEKRNLVAQLTNDADVMEARIKEVAELEEKGFWMCENGHEVGNDARMHNSEPLPGCPTCHKPAKLIKRDQMTGQEKYESDKDRGEAEKIAQSNRDKAKQLENEAGEGEKTAKYFRDLAANNRKVADRIRNL